LNRDENQHYVSRVLLERWKTPGVPLQCFDVESRTWIARSIDNACAAGGYNQLLAFDGLDNTLEQAFSKIETRLPKTFRALEKAATRGPTELPESVYDNICWYCVFLKLSSLPAKAAAVVNFVLQLNLEIERGQRVLLRELQISEDTIGQWKASQAADSKVIIDSENVLQLIYRHQFRRMYQEEFGIFRDTQWAISVSPIELPLSDTGLVSLSGQGENYYILPIGPNLVLEGAFSFDLAKNKPRRPVKTLTLTEDQAMYTFDAICSSAVIEIIAKREIPNISDSFVRARNRGIRFHKIVDPKSIRIAGLQSPTDQIRFRVVPTEEYVQFIHSFVQPPTDSVTYDSNSSS